MAKSHHPKSVDVFFLPTLHEKSSSCANKVMAACHWSASEQAAMAASAGGAACAGRSATGKMRKNNGRTRENREYMGTKTENHGKIWQNHHVQIIFGMENHGLTMYYHGSEILHKSSRATNKCSTKPGLQMKVLLNNAVCLHMIFRSRQHMANQNSDWYNNNGQLRIIKLKNIGRNDPPTPPFLVVSNLAIF